jgi:hypothetical protein
MAKKKKARRAGSKPANRNTRTKSAPTAKKRTASKPKSVRRQAKKTTAPTKANARRRTPSKPSTQPRSQAAGRRGFATTAPKSASIYQMMAAGYPWGPLGAVLWNGVGKFESGAMLLERTGPYVPPISQPAGFVVTDAVRQSLELSGLSGFAFKPVRKAKIVRLDGSGWDRSAKSPKDWQADQKPEHLLASRPHDPELASSLGELHQLVSSGGPPKRGGAPRSPAEIAMHFRMANGVDICVDGEGGATYVSERARRWFADRYGDMLKFTAI